MTSCARLLVSARRHGRSSPSGWLWRRRSRSRSQPSARAASQLPVDPTGVQTPSRTAIRLAAIASPGRGGASRQSAAQAHTLACSTSAPCCARASARKLSSSLLGRDQGPRAARRPAAHLRRHTVGLGDRHVQRRAHHRKRRAQLVRGVGHEPPLTSNAASRRASRPSIVSAKVRSSSLDPASRGARADCFSEILRVGRLSSSATVPAPGRYQPAERRLETTHHHDPKARSPNRPAAGAVRRCAGWSPAHAVAAPGLPPASRWGRFRLLPKNCRFRPWGWRGCGSAPRARS